MERSNSVDKKIIFGTIFEQSQHWSDEEWKSTMAKGGGNKKRSQYCTDSSGEILYLRALQGHSRRNPRQPQRFCLSPCNTEQSQICVKNARPAMLEQGDLFWQDNLTHCLSQQVC